MVSVKAGALDDLGNRVRMAAPAHRYVIVTDTVVGPLYARRAVTSFGAGVAVDVLTIPAGEASKTRSTWAQLTDDVIALGCGRDTTLVAL